jgi:hypothetical protein
MKTMRAKLAVIAVAAFAVVGAGGAIAATGALGGPREESKAILDDAAKQLGVDSQKLSDALRNAMANRIDAAVAAGQLTKEQGDAIKERIRSDGFPLLGMRPPLGFGHHGPGMHHRPFGAKLDAAAEYLGLSEEKLRADLESGKTLAEIAKAEGKTVAGLVDALLAAPKAKLDAAVESGRLTRAQADAMIAALTARLTEMVNGAMPPKLRGFHFDGSRGPHIAPEGALFELPA